MSIRKYVYFFLTGFWTFASQIALSQTKLDQLNLPFIRSNIDIESFDYSNQFYLRRHHLRSRAFFSRLMDLTFIEPDKKLQNHFNTTDQLKLSLGSFQMPNPFVLINAIRSIHTDSALGYGQTKKFRWLDDNWIVRGILGIDQPVLDNFIAGLGIGAVIINPNLNGNAAFLNLSSIEDNQVLIRPSVLASATWLVCSTCFVGYGGSISLQVAVDQYPNMNLNTSAYENFFSPSNPNQKWQWSEMLVFNIRI